MRRRHLEPFGAILDLILRAEGHDPWHLELACPLWVRNGHLEPSCPLCAIAAVASVVYDLGPALRGDR